MCMVIYLYICVCVYVYVYVCMCMCMYIYTCMRVYEGGDMNITCRSVYEVIHIRGEGGVGGGGGRRRDGEGEGSEEGEGSTPSQELRVNHGVSEQDSTNTKQDTQQHFYRPLTARKIEGIYNQGIT